MRMLSTLCDGAIVSLRPWCGVCILLTLVGMSDLAKGTPVAGGESPLCPCKECLGYLRELLQSFTFPLTTEEWDQLATERPQSCAPHNLFAGCPRRRSGMFLRRDTSNMCPPPRVPLSLALLNCLCLAAGVFNCMASAVLPKYAAMYAED